MAIKAVIEEKCVGCGACYRACPADVFRLDPQTRKAKVQYPQDCELCMWCVTECKQNALVMEEGKTFQVFTCWG